MTAVKKSILIAEDEKPLNHALSLKLAHEGYEVSSAFDGKEALDLIAKNKFDLVLLDLIMPNVDGFGVLKHIKDEGIKLPVIVLSNLGQPEDKTRSEALGAEGFFIKSDIALSEIVSLVNAKLKAG